MSFSTEDFARVVESFQNAAIGAGAWETALEGLARATGSRSAQLCGDLGDEASTSFNLVTEFPPEAFEQAPDNLFHLAVNSRVRIGGRAPELTVLDETAFTTAEDMRRHPEYGEWIRRYDVPFICLSPLVHCDGLMVGLSVPRRGVEGNITPEQKRIYTALAHHARAAVRTQMALEAQGATLLTDGLGAVSIAAFVCDAWGRVRAMSAPAERLVAGGRWLRLHGGRLAARHNGDTARLLNVLGTAALARAEAGAPPQGLVVHDQTGADPLLLEVAVMPGEHAFRFGAAALLIARPPRDDEPRLRETARALYGLTAAEAAVAAKLAAGLGPQAVAEQTGVAVGTVRTHIRSIFEKARVRSQVELVAALTARL